MAATLSGNRREISDAKFVEAINRSDSLELVPWDEVRGMFPEKAETATDEDRWRLADGQPGSKEPDLLEAAEHLMLMGHKEPAALVCRVALERRFRELCGERAVSLPDRATVTLMIDLLRSRSVLPCGLFKRSFSVSMRLNHVAHGGEITLFEAVKLAGKSRKILEELDRL